MKLILAVFSWALLFGPAAWGETSRRAAQFYNDGDTIETLENNGPRYVIKSLLGSGTFGTVYLVDAFEGELSRGTRAVKLLPLELDPTGKRWLMPQNGYDRVTAATGGKVPASLMPFNPERYTAVIRTSKGTRSRAFRAIEMDVADESAAVSREFRLSGKMSPAEFSTRVTNSEHFLANALTAIGDLAALGLTHGDVKPANFLAVKVGNEVHWKLGDLDGVRPFGSVSQLNVLTASPEQLRGYSTSASDAFGVAASLFKEMFGQFPAAQYLIEHSDNGKLPSSHLKLSEALKDLYGSEEKMAALQAIIRDRFENFETRYPAEAARLGGLRDFIIAGLDPYPRRRAHGLGKLPVAAEWAQRSQGFHFDFEILSQFCGYLYRHIGLPPFIRRSINSAPPIALPTELPNVAY